MGPPENVLGTSRINLPVTSLERRIKTFSGRHFRTSPGHQIGTSPGRQIGTSPGRSNRIFRGHPGDARGDVPSGRPGDQYLPAGSLPIKISSGSLAKYMVQVSSKFLVEI